MVDRDRDRYDREFENRGVNQEHWTERRVGTDRGYRNTDAGGSWGEQMTVDTHRPGPWVGRGPKNWQRTDERVLEDINEALTRHPAVDATDVEVQVANGEATLTGVVGSRQEKRIAGDCAWQVAGIRDVHNQLKIQPRTE